MPPGPKPRPPLHAVREGNPGHRPIREGMKLDPEAPAEPDWTQHFPKGSRTPGTTVRARNVARRAWRRIVPILDAQGLISTVDLTILADLCICEARIDQCERDITRRGVSIVGDKGQGYPVKNHSITAAAQYRTQLRFLVAELGLTPSSRGRLETAGGGGHLGDDDTTGWDV